MFKITRKTGITLGLSLLAACTVALAADNHGLFNPGATNVFDLPNGGRVVEAASSGFNIMGDTSDPLHMSNSDCNGTTESDADGEGTPRCRSGAGPASACPGRPRPGTISTNASGVSRWLS